MAWPRAISLALAWQAVPAALLMWVSWDSPTWKTYALASLVLLIIPTMSGFVYRSWRVGLACLLLPFLAFGAMLAIAGIIMGNGR
jgi:hypothetical protein